MDRRKIDHSRPKQTTESKTDQHPPGVDQIAEREGKDLRRIILPAAWRQKGRQAGLIRNGWVSRIADSMIAAPSSWGSGTQHAIGLMERVVRKPVTILDCST